jgi:opacity protein-like surface antigen
MAMSMSAAVTSSSGSSRVAFRVIAASVLALALLAGSGAPARADSLVGFSAGYFALRSADARSENDVLWRNLDFLAFDLQDFNHAIIGGEYLVGIGDYIEAGAGVAYYQRTVPSIYRDFVDRDGSEIEQDLKLRVVPFTATVRFFPASRRGGVQPYLGAGVGVLAWRYSESGEFIDFRDRSIFRATFKDQGSTAVPVLLGGVRVAVGDTVLVGGEFRWQEGEATLDPSQRFAGDTIDLGGYTTLFVVHVRF